MTKEEILNNLNEQQKLPVINYLEPIVVIAGAGAGKTHMIVQKVAYMLLDGIKSENILMFTFTKKAAEEMKERVIKTVGSEAENMTVCTYHSFCVKQLRKYCHLIGFNNPFSIYDEDQVLEIIKGILERNELDYDPRHVSSIISKYKLKMYSPKEAIIFEKENKEYAYIQQIMKAQNAFNFDDLIYYMIRIMEHHPDVLQEINFQFKYILADEIQDASTEDLRFIKLLAGKNMYLCMVGDHDQSIYAFRGSNINAWYDFIQENNLKIYYLEQNYRSTQTIVNASNSVIENNEKMFDKNAFSKNEEGAKVVSFTLPTHKKEAARVALIVKTCLDRGYKEEDIAVLYRMGYLARPIEDIFLSSGINYTMVNGTPFYSRAEVKDLLSYLQVFNNPRDFSAISRAIQVPKRGIGEKAQEELIFHFLNSVEKIKDIASMKEVLLSCPKLSSKAMTGLRNFCAILEQIEINSAFMNPSMLLEYVIEATDYKEFLKKTRGEEEFEGRVEVVRELIGIAKQTSDLTDLLQTMAVNHDQEESKKGVTLSTIHSSKGLEWPIVIIIGCNEMQIPSYMAIKSNMEEEERRLFYVGMTRAKSALFLTRHEKSNRTGIWRSYEESRFVREISEEYIKRM